LSTRKESFLLQRAQPGTRTVAAAIPGCRRAGAASPAETGVHCKHRVLLGKESFLPGGWEARPLRQARMPDATTVRGPSCALLEQFLHGNVAQFKPVVNGVLDQVVWAACAGHDTSV